MNATEHETTRTGFLLFQRCPITRASRQTTINELFIFVALMSWFLPGCAEDKDKDIRDNPVKALGMIPIAGGTFNMGSEDGIFNELPVHAVTVPGFEMMKTEVQVQHFEECVNAGGCAAAHSRTKSDSEYCNYEYTDRADHPMNCIDWRGAKTFCEWAGVRLPSEAEWEYAARSGGEDVDYPWGDEEASCAYAVMGDPDPGCGEDRTWPVCSKVEGQTVQALCDMSGNVAEWVEDRYHESYEDAPSNGKAWNAGEEEMRMVRGGAWDDDTPSDMRTWNRRRGDPSDSDVDLGFRCAK